MKKIWKRLGVLLTGAAACFALSAAVSADVGINTDNFPDDVFRAYVASNFDTDTNKTLSDAELSAVTAIDVSLDKGDMSEPIKSLKGIEYFTKLTTLKCFRNKLTSLDVSHNTELKILYAGIEFKSSAVPGYYESSATDAGSFNVFTALDLSKNTKLEELSITGVGITSLDVSKNTALKILYCSFNELTNLDLKNNSALLQITCAYNKLTSLDVSNNTSLIYLHCMGNRLTSLDVSKNTKLDYYDFSANTYTISPENGTFALSNLPAGFDASKASGWTGAEYDSATNSLKNITGKKITYNYNCGNGKSAVFTLDFESSGTEPELKGITVTPPTVTTYFIGESLNTAGMKIVASYSDGSTKNIPLTDKDVKITGFDSSAEGSCTVTVSFGKESATFTVTIKKAVALKKLILTAPKTLTYPVGAPLDTTGMIVKAMYVDNSVVDISLDDPELKITGFDSSKPGKCTVTVTYRDKSKGFEVTITGDAAQKLTGITVTAPTKKSYYVGEELDLTGAKLTASYDDNSTKDIPFTDSSVKITGYDKSKTGKQTITVTYGENTASFEVTVSEKPAAKVTGITVTAPTKKSYYVGEELDLTGAKLTASYDDNSTKDIPFTDSGVIISGYDKDKTGKQTITVTYGEKTASFEVTVSEKPAPKLTGITVEPPAKKIYFIGEELDLAGVKITAAYDDNTTKEIAVGSADFDGFDSSKAGACTVTVTFEEKTASFEVTIKEKAVTGITVAPPARTSFIIGEDLDINSMTLTAFFEDNTSAEIPLTGEMISGFDNTKTGKCTVTVTYKEHTASFEVTIEEKPTAKVVAIVVVPPAKTEYFIGQSLDLKGAKLTVRYDNAAEREITLTLAMTSGFDSSKAGSCTVIVSYEGQTASFGVTVKEKQLTDLTLKPPAKTKYFVGEVLDLTGAKLTANYDDGSSVDIPLTVGMTSGFDSSKAGSCTVIVTYENKTASFEVTVKEKQLAELTLDPPAKTKYFVGEALDLTGATLTANYDDGSSVDIPLTVGMTSGFDSSKEGTCIVIVTYESKTASFEVTVEEDPALKADVLLDGVPAESLSKALKSLKEGDHIIEINAPVTLKTVTIPKKLGTVSIRIREGAALTANTISAGSPLVLSGSVQAEKSGKYVKVNAKSDFFATGCTLGNVTVKGKANLTNVTVNGTLKLSSKADKTYATTDTLTNVTVTKKVTSNNSVIFENCPSIGAVTAKGNVTVSGTATKAVSVTAKANSGTTSLENLTITKKISVKSLLNVNGSITALGTVSAAGIGSTKGAVLSTTGLSISKSGLTGGTKVITLKITDKKGNVKSFSSGKKVVSKFKGYFDPEILTLGGQTLYQKSGKLYLA